MSRPVSDTPVDDNKPEARAFRQRVLELHGLTGDPKTTQHMLKLLGKHGSGRAEDCYACTRAYGRYG